MTACHNKKNINYASSNECYAPVTMESNNFLPHNSVSLSEDGALFNFYKNGTILITGGTGFIGKALVEKLLRTCSSVSRIYLLIRPKKGQSVEDRCKSLLSNPVFDRIRLEGDSEKLLSKVTCISGDITEPNLGLTDDQIKLLTQNVSVVFHSAASIRFDDTLEAMLKHNFWSTQRIVFICRKMIKLKALVHVSTAYSNANRENVGEIVYPIPELKREMLHPDELVPMEFLLRVGKILEPNHPNTYTVTKAMAEIITAEFAKDLPAIIIRPSIVTAAWREPFEGWIDNATGITGLILGGQLGMISSMPGNKNFISDMIPVDTVVNTLIAGAHYISTCSDDGSLPIVVNCTSGSVNPISWGKLCFLCTQYILVTPSKYVQWYPGTIYHTNRFLHSLHELICEFLPALFVDLIIKLTGYKTENLKYSFSSMCNKFKKLKLCCQFFTSHQWNFTSKNIQLLQESLRHPSEREIFNMDITTLDWDTYIKHYIFGIRKYVLQDSADSIPSAQKKIRRLYWIQKITRIISIVVIYKLIVICFNFLSDLFHHC